MTKREFIIEIPWPLAILVAIFIFFILGWYSSPHYANGRPMLLMPDIKAAEDYRRDAKSWVGQMRSIDGEINNVMSSDSSDLIGATQRAQNMLNHSVQLARTIDQRETPPVFAGLRDQLYEASLAYLDAARLAARWLSVPNEENLDAANTARQTARSLYNDLVVSRWLTQP